MDIRDLSYPITSKRLNENLANKLGYSIKLDKFSDAQLRDVQNKLRTEISQAECTESYDGILENHRYQKTRMFLDIVNQAILEREMTPSEKSKEKTIKKKVDPSGMKNSMSKQYGPEKGKNVYFATIRKRAMKEAVPTAWIDNAIERIDLGEASRAELKAELKLRYDLNEATASWLLCEGEELKADIIIATRDMVDQITGWLEDVAAMKAEQFLELIDSINSELGSNVAQQYSNLVKPALEQIYTALETSRQELTNGLSVVSGGEMETMGATPASTAGGIPSEAILGMGGGEVEPTPPMQGREKRESVEYSRRLGILLNSKKN